MRHALLVLIALGLAAPTGFAQTKFPEFAKVVEGAKVYEGMLKLHRSKDRLLVELPAASFGKDYLWLPSISRGIGEGHILGGMSLNFGDDWVMTFRRVDDAVFLVRKNVRFTADKETPAKRAVDNSYTDSIVMALPIATIAPSGAVVIDLSQIFLNDFVGLGAQISGAVGSPVGFDRSRSTYHAIKTFPENIEIDIAAVYGGGRAGASDTVPDARGVQIGVHYSISELPKTNYRPRLADPRIGYFLSVHKDYTKETSDTAFVRYINRWNLEKADASANPSPPKAPIRFYIENTVPFRWRPYVVEGILAWNKAFDKLGFSKAIEVQDLPPDADPEDIRYNTFRWITTGAGFAMGPSRVNPYTGQILDADIIFDSDMVRYWQLEFEDLVATKQARPRAIDFMNPKSPDCKCNMCEFGEGMRHQMGMLALAHLALAPDKPQLPDVIIGQAVREVTMHEVGHTLGLRHNFKASTWKTLEQINSAKPDEPTVGSVMDYAPANLQPKGKPQGPYFTPTLGPWDEWVIEYGYSVLPGGDQEKTKLAEIASRSPKPELTYATDEDTRGIDPDPLTNRFDLGADPIAYSRQEIELVKSLLPGIVDKVTQKGDGYQKARRAFTMLLHTQLRSNQRVCRYVGGQYMNRNHKGDPDGKPPFVTVSAARQREALGFLRDNLFSDASFQFPAELLNSLAPSRWSHWGTRGSLRLDFPIHQVILSAQSAALEEVLDSITLDRLRDNELRYAKGEEPFTMPELFRTLTDSIWTEIMPAPAPAPAPTAASPAPPAATAPAKDVKPAKDDKAKDAKPAAPAKDAKPAAKDEKAKDAKPAAPAKEEKPAAAPASVPAPAAAPAKPAKIAISSFRRALQREHLAKLIELRLKNTTVPPDARDLAALQLRDIYGRIAAAISNVADDYTKAHLAETHDRIRRALGANFNQIDP